MWSSPDNEIDEVARELTAAPPPRRLHARVMEAIRLEVDQTPAGNVIGISPSPRVWRLWWVLSPAAVAAVILLAVLLRGGSSTPPQPSPRPDAPRLGSGQALRLRSGQADGSPQTAESRSSSPIVSAQRAGARPTSAREQRAAPAPEPDSVAQIPALSVAPLGGVEVRVTVLPAPDAIEPKALTLAPFALAPLTPDESQPDRR